MTIGPKEDLAAKARNDRRTVLAGLAISLALHGVLLGRKTAPAPLPATASEEEPAEPPRFSTPVLEVVRLEIEKPVKPVQQEATAVAPAVEPALAEPSPEAAGAARPRRVALSMRPNFAALHPATAFALDPVPIPQREAAEPSDDDDTGRSFWQRLGISTGRGGGACPIPRKPSSPPRG